MPNVELIRELGVLEEHRAWWQELLAQTPGASFFHSWEWLRAYWRRFGQGQELRILLVSGPHGAEGIVPLVLRREKTRLGCVRVLTYPLQDWGSYYGPIGPRPEETLRSAMSHLKCVRRDWDLIDLRWIDEKLDDGASQRALESAGIRAQRGEWDRTCLLDLPATWDSYFSTLTSKFRNNVRRAEKRLQQEGAATLERYRPAGAAQGLADPRWDLYDECVELAHRSWQGASTDGTTLSHPEVASFFRETHEAAAQRGELDLLILRLEGRAIAFAYNYHVAGAVYGLRSGYDPGFADCGAGTVLMAWMLRDGIQRGDRRYDLGVATKEIKMRWNPRLARLGRLTHYPAASPRAQALAWKHRWDAWKGELRILGANSRAQSDPA